MSRLGTPRANSQRTAWGSRPASRTLFLDTRGIHVGITLANRSDGEPGLLIAGVCEEDGAARAGFQPGDVIVSLDGEAMSDHEAAVKKIDSAVRDCAVLSIECIFGADKVQRPRDRPSSRTVVSSVLGTKRLDKVAPAADNLLRQVL